jgi:hypothetical protein
MLIILAWAGLFLANIYFDIGPNKTMKEFIGILFTAFASNDNEIKSWTFLWKKS